MNIFLIILIFYFGTAIGSFLSVLIHRYKEKKPGILLGRSMCPHCKTKLQALDLIPLASYLLLKRKCRFCEKEISPHYFYLELLTGIIFASLFLKFSFLEFTQFAPYTTFHAKELMIFFSYAVISSFLMLIFFYDLLYKEIPDIFSLPPVAVVLAAGFILGIPSWQEMLIGGAAAGVFFQGQILFSGGRWLGGGDTRLGILMGILLGWKLLIVAVFTAYMLGTGISIYLLIGKKVDMKSSIAFGPYLVTGTFFAIFLGKFVVEWYGNFLNI